MNQSELIQLAQDCGLLFFTEEFPKSAPAQQRLISRLVKFAEGVKTNKVTDEEIMQIWKDLPAQGDPTGKKFAVKFAREILDFS